MNYIIILIVMVILNVSKTQSNDEENSNYHKNSTLLPFKLINNSTKYSNSIKIYNLNGKLIDELTDINLYAENIDKNNYIKLINNHVNLLNLINNLNSSILQKSYSTGSKLFQNSTKLPNRNISSSSSNPTILYNNKTNSKINSLLHPIVEKNKNKIYSTPKANMEHLSTSTNQTTTKISFKLNITTSLKPIKVYNSSKPNETISSRSKQSIITSTENESLINNTKSTPISLITYSMKTTPTLNAQTKFKIHKYEHTSPSRFSTDKDRITMNPKVKLVYDIVNTERPVDKLRSMPQEMVTITEKLTHKSSTLFSKITSTPASQNERKELTNSNLSFKYKTQITSTTSNGELNSIKTSSQSSVYFDKTLSIFGTTNTIKNSKTSRINSSSESTSKFTLKTNLLVTTPKIDYSKSSTTIREIPSFEINTYQEKNLKKLNRSLTTTSNRKKSTVHQLTSKNLVSHLSFKQSSTSNKLSTPITQSTLSDNYYFRYSNKSTIISVTSSSTQNIKSKNKLILTLDDLINSCPKSLENYCYNDGECYLKLYESNFLNLIEKIHGTNVHSAIPNCKCKSEYTLNGLIMLSYTGSRCEIITQTFTYLSMGLLISLIIFFIIFVILLAVIFKTIFSCYLTIMKRKNSGNFSDLSTFFDNYNGDDGSNSNKTFKKNFQNYLNQKIEWFRKLPSVRDSWKYIKINNNSSKRADNSNNEAVYLNLDNLDLNTNLRKTQPFQSPVSIPQPPPPLFQIDNNHLKKKFNYKKSNQNNCNHGHMHHHYHNQYHQNKRSIYNNQNNLQRYLTKKSRKLLKNMVNNNDFTSLSDENFIFLNRKLYGVSLANLKQDNNGTLSSNYSSISLNNLDNLCRSNVYVYPKPSRISTNPKRFNSPNTEQEALYY